MSDLSPFSGVDDWWRDNYEKQTEPGEQKVDRGGAWNSDAADLRVSYRDRCLPGEPGNDIGFRCVRDLAPAPKP